MATVTLEFKKRSDGSAMLAFVRADGSRTWTPIGSSESFGPVHDPSHYVVESVLGIACGFIGLCGEGWSVGDFEKSAARRLPPEALAAEVLAGEISRMEMAGQWLPLEEFQAVVATAGVVVTAQQYAAIRRAPARLRVEWRALAAAETLVLAFEPGRVAAVSVEGVLA